MSLQLLLLKMFELFEPRVHRADSWKLIDHSALVVVVVEGIVVAADSGVEDMVVEEKGCIPLDSHIANLVASIVANLVASIVDVAGSSIHLLLLHQHQHYFPT